MSKTEVKPTNRTRIAVITGLCCFGFLFIAAAVPGVLLLTGDQQFQIGSWGGVRWLPKNHPWIGQTKGVQTMSEGFSAALGGHSNVNGTRMTIPPGLVHTELKQWGRVQWWRTRVVRKAGTYQPNEVRALQQQIDTASRQRALASRRSSTP